MRTYKIELQRTQCLTLEIEAKSREEAEDEALTEAECDDELWTDSPPAELVYPRKKRRRRR